MNVNNKKGQPRLLVRVAMDCPVRRKGDRMGVRSPQLNTTNYQDKTMTDIHNSAQRARLFPWIIVRLLPNLQRITVGRFRHRSHAEGHLRVLKQVMPMADFAIAFDLMRE